MSDILGRLRGLLSDKDKRLKLIFTLGVIGIMLIVLPDLLPKGQQEQNGSSDPSAKQSLDEAQTYKADLEKQLTEVIESIDGAGKARIMLNVTATKEYVYAEKSDTDRRTQKESESLRSQGEPVLSGDSPVLRKILTPQVSGAAVICEGADDPVTRERIFNTVSALLGIPPSRISVTTMAE